MIFFRGKGVRVGEQWFDEPDTAAAVKSGADVVFYYQAKQPFQGGPSQTFTTLVLDLRLAHDQLRADFSRTNRYDIKRAEERDGLEFDFFPEPDAARMEEFRGFFREFAEKKGLHELGTPRLMAYANAGRIVLARARETATGKVLCWHAHIVGSGRARLLYSASVRLSGSFTSEDLSRLARANRWLHWREILEFKDRGYLVYDLGGWNPHPANKQLEGINLFKEGFSKQKEESYTGWFPVTLRGRAYLWLKSFLR